MTITPRFLTYMATWFALILVSCDPEGKDDIKKIPASQAKVSITPNVTYDLGFGAPKVYRGDTIKYAVNVSVPESIKEIKVMELVNDVPTDISFSAITSFDNINSHSFEFTYVVTDTVTRKYFVQVTEANSAVNNKHINTNENPLISVSPKEIEEYRNLKLYNTLGENGNGFRLTLQNFAVFEQKDNFISYSYFLYNPTNEENLLNLSFVRGFMAHQENGSKFVKVNDLNFGICTANDIHNEFVKNADKAQNVITNVSKGEIYIGKLYNNKYIENRDIFIGYTYGIIKVISIADDLKTIEEGGSNDDYLEFDFKTFNNFRFK